MPRLPAIRSLLEQVQGASTGRGESVADSVAYLVQQRAELTRWEDIEDLALDAFGDSPTPLSGAIAHHLIEVRAALAAELYARQVFVGGSVLDDLLFFALRNTTTPDPLLAALEFIRDRRVNRPGLVLMPLHGFGILGAGFLHSVTRRRVSVLRPEWGIALTPQTNRLSATVAWLEHARQGLGVRKAIPAEIVHHFHRSRAEWLEVNPLLAVPVVNIAGATCENQRLLMSRVRAATGLIALAATQQADDDDGPVLRLSSSRTNNWETLDIHHYIVFSDNPAHSGRELEAAIVPLNLDREDVYELTDLDVQLDPRLRSRRLASFQRLEAAVTVVYEGYLRHSIGRGAAGTRGRTHRKVFGSLDYFRRSYRSGGGTWSNVLSLAIAFEMLLTDSSGRGMTDQIVQRVGIVLRGVPNVRRHERAVRDLFSVRGGIVHKGDEASVDLRPARRAYAAVFSRVAPGLPAVQSTWSEPMRRLVGA
jgi:hypothetical protein